MTATKKPQGYTVMVGKGLKPEEGRAKGIKMVMNKHSGDFRGANYDPKTGKCKVL